MKENSIIADMDKFYDSLSDKEKFLLLMKLIGAEEVEKGKFELRDFYACKLIKFSFSPSIQIDTLLQQCVLGRIFKEGINRGHAQMKTTVISQLEDLLFPKEED